MARDQLALSLNLGIFRTDYLAKNEAPEEEEAEGGGWGWWMEPLPEVFGMLQYFETILPSVESL